MNNRYGVGSRSSGISLPKFSFAANRGLIIGLILFVALIAFEIFNFDTTQFALQSLLGNVTFIGLQWATILAIAFCAIDFAGLNRLFTPEGSQKEQKEVWFLMGAWLLGATMNAVMTWWAVSVTLMNNNLGNEVLSRQQLLRYVPIFVAVLVWLTRILFIGSFSIAGVSIIRSRKKGNANSRGKAQPTNSRSSRSSRSASPARMKAAPKRVNNPVPKQSATNASSDTLSPAGAASQRSSRVRQRPPMPNASLRRGTTGMQARTRQ